MTNPLNLSIPALASRVPDEAAAYEVMEQLRWPDRPVCPHCGSAKMPYFLNPQGAGRKTRTGKVSPRRVWKCADCRKQFSVLTGTIFHGSKIPVRTWLFVVVEMCASKNGVAAREIERKYGLTSKSAWYMTQRIRHAMAQEPGALAPFQGTVVADEAYIGGRTRKKHGTFQGTGKVEKVVPPKTPVVTLINEETGEARSRVVPSVTADTLANTIMAQVDVDRARLFTDEHQGYKMVGRWMGLGHQAVNHGHGEYVRGEVTTNSVESFFSQLKRSIDGTHHHVSPEHLHRYLAEFDFRHTTRKMTDAQRVSRLMGQTRGRRLTYRPPGQ
jgi:transposase-like protein